MPASSKARLSQASDLYEEFTGHNADNMEVVDFEPFDTGLKVGTMDGLMYTAVRDGVTEHYIHKFKKSARPDLAVSHDGTRFVPIGGNFTFTEAGFVDD